ncbi:MAG: hypothetical protein OXG24_04515 [Gammaproteobacteria bacterium]|nr:hypothetical protein [Gammaproteobacteria bacterium]
MGTPTNATHFTYMKQLLSAIGLALLISVLTSCSSNPPITYSITGDFIVVEDPEAESRVDADDTAIDTSSDSEAALTSALDSDSITISVTYQTKTEDGETATIQLASGSFVDGKISFRGIVDEPTRVKISADVGEGDQFQFSVEALLTHGQEVKFALVDFWGQFPYDQLVLVGGSHLSQDSSKKFTIAADLSAVEEDLSSAIVDVYGEQYDEEGESQILELGRILLVDKRFVVEADIDEPTVFTGYIITFGNFHGAFNVVAEPNVNIEVYAHGDGSSSELLATSNSGLHKNLIESWQQSDEYLTTLDEYSAAYKQYLGTYILDYTNCDFLPCCLKWQF